MNPSALSAAVLQRGGTFPTICACCRQLFQARNVHAAYCGVNCRRRARYYRQQGRPIPLKASSANNWTQPIRPQVVQAQIIEDPNDLPLSWQQPGRAQAPLAPFAYAGHQVRVITDQQGMPWFVAADVCAVLGMGNPTQALSRLDDDEKTLISNEGQGWREAPTMNAVNESGLYSLILGSRKPEARAFKRWVTHDVLPAIRRTGGYSIPTARPQPPQLPEGVHVVAATRRRAAELWWEAISREVNATMSRRLNPAYRSDAGLPLAVSYQWQQLSLPA
jgi:prophage antirepressor-like protein